MTFQTDPSSSEYAEALRAARVSLGLTQKQLADGVGISKVMIGRYETKAGKKNSARPSSSTDFALKSFFESMSRSSASDTDKSEIDVSAISLDKLLTEIRRRGYKITLESVSNN